ncbi:MAG: hypothetical protein J0L97_03505 [Alphaproteobacteria bacterium]|nr:hypothetical protein [Alphaproteobacteria bacterium]
MIQNIFRSYADAYFDAGYNPVPVGNEKNVVSKKWTAHGSNLPPAEFVHAGVSAAST